MSPPIPDFCTACGRSTDAPDCPDGHDDAAPSEDVGIGQVVTYKRALRGRTAVVVGRVRSGAVVVEVKDGEERGRAKYEQVAGTEAWLAIPSQLYRLEGLAKTSQWHGVLEPWLAENRESLLATIGDRRAFAMAAMGAGDLALGESSGLSTSEITWLAMHVQRDSRDLYRAFYSALRLDPDTYPDHPLVLLEAVAAHPELLEEPQLRKHAENLNPEFTGVAALRAATGLSTVDDAGAVATDLDHVGAATSAADIRSVATGTESVATNLWSRAATGAPVTPNDLGTIEAEYPAVADDLLDAGRVERLPASTVESPYLRARIDVRTATDDELRSLGATRELARRAYVSDDRASLGALFDEAPSVASYYVALDALRSGEVPEVLPDDDTLKAVAASLRSRRAHPNALADASTWPVLGDVITDEEAGQYPEQASAWQLERAFDDLASWRFESALTRARFALRDSNDEAIRDEALNIVGFVLYQQGGDEAAISALEKALEGDYSANLQANIGIIAEDLQPEIAALHLGQLAEEAPTLDLQLAAVRHAFGIWTTRSDAWDEDGLVMPANLLSMFRTLAVADVPHDDYVPLLQLLARADEEWLADRGNTQHGPHVESAARRIYVAKASHDPSDYVDALAEVSKQANQEDWFVEEKDNFVQSLRSLIFSEEGSIGPASYAFGAIDAGLELDDFDYVTLASGAAISILGAIANDEGLPSDKVRDMVGEAHRRARLLDHEQRQTVDPLVAIAGNQFGAVVAGFHAHVHDEIVDALRNIGGQLYGMSRRRVNWTVVDDAVKPMRSQLRESASEVQHAKSFVSDEDLGESLQGLIDGLKSLAAKLSNPRSFFS